MMLSKDEICLNTGKALRTYVEFPQLGGAHSAGNGEDAHMQVEKASARCFSLLLIKVLVVGIFSFWH